MLEDARRDELVRVMPTNETGATQLVKYLLVLTPDTMDDALPGSPTSERSLEAHP